MIPLLRLSASPRIVNVASMAGHLRIIHDQFKKDELSRPDLTLEELNFYMNLFVVDVKSGRHSGAGWPSTCYGMSKLGVIALTRVLAREHRDMSVTSCCPGYCDTDMTSHKGPRSPEEGARTPAMLATLPHDSALAASGKFFENEAESEW